MCHEGSRVEPPGQGGRSRLTCSPTELRVGGGGMLSQAQKVRVNYVCMGGRGDVAPCACGSRATGGGKVEPPGQGQRSRLTCSTRRAQSGVCAISSPKKYR